MQKVLPLALALLTVALAGCSDEAPSGEFAFQNHSVALAGTATNEYTEFNDPVGGQDPTGQAGTDCAQDQFPPGTPIDQQKCTQPQTTISIVFSQLPDPEGKSYSAALIDASGTDPAKDLGTLEAGAGGSYSLNFTEAVDYSNEEQYSYTHVLVSVVAGSNPVPVAIASADAGSQSFDIHEALTSGVDFDATWKGRDLTLTVSGLNSTFAYQGWLVSEGGEHTESFPVTNGEVTHRAERNVGDYTEFHLHVAGTKVNVGVARIG